MSVDYQRRHIGPTAETQSTMLTELGYPTLDELCEAAIPASVRLNAELNLPPAISEAELVTELAGLADRNELRTPMVGLGYYRSHTPAVIRRNVLENPAWYTAYTPYQPEISQGRLEALLVFQTMVSDLTGMDIANASLLDEPTAAAEAMSLSRRVSKSKANRFIVDADTHPQTLAVLGTRAEPLGIELVVADLDDGLPDGDAFGILLSYPGSSGRIRDFRSLASEAHEGGAVVTAATDLLALTLLTPPGEWGADVSIGSAQRFGVPLGFGGPHAGFMALREDWARNLPGRLVGVSADADGQPAYRLALQTREQHIRRERATSNICTSQVLLAVMSAFYGAYHGPEGLAVIASRVHSHAVTLSLRLSELGLEPPAALFFDTVTLCAPGLADGIVKAIASRGIDVRLVDADRFAVSVDETTTADHIDAVCAAVAEIVGRRDSGSGTARSDIAKSGTAHASTEKPPRFPAAFARESDFMSHPWFHQYRSETAMMRWLRRLSDFDLALDRTMIPLGSCTMKLNSAAVMEPISWAGFADIHPFGPPESASGYSELIDRVSTWLAELTGYAAVSIQPNAGSQGEFAGLLAIRAYHRERGEGHRTVCLIPSSAHGTNAASAAMAGMRVVVVACDHTGGVDLDDLQAKVAEHRDQLAAIMVTYPSTYGVYEDTVGQVAAIVHEAGGQVYVDGANLNALVGLAAPGEFGADVSHLNLHKTFCIPHGGGGPGVGPVGVREHLVKYLPSHPFLPDSPANAPVGAISGAPYGSAGILPIPYGYLRMMGASGLKAATQNAVLTANYVAARLRDHYPILYTGNEGLVAHECILDLRDITKETGVTVDDVAKRLIDYGFHAPTMSFPIAGTLMVEPTESEDLAELDRFCEAMIAIHAEIDRVASGEWAVEESPLRAAPHTAHALVQDWERPYSRDLGAYPVAGMVRGKYWPPVSRIDGAYGDRNLMCSCPPPEAFE
ncbi:MAG: aminomethyl-transferring glycine dehydrogenase [Candidatus Nanopelagicales bacterium]